MNEQYYEDYPDSHPEGAAERGVPQGNEQPEAIPDEGYAGADIVAVATDILGGQLRDRPIPTLLAAVAAGWLLGKILR